MPFQLPELPFAKDALAPRHVGRDARISSRQASQGLCHQDQRADRGRQATSAAPRCSRWSRRPSSPGNSKLFNNSAQLWNHSFFWQCLAPAAGPAAGRQARQADRGRLRQCRSAAREAAGRSGQPFLQRLGVAGARPRQLAGDVAPRCRHADRSRGHGAAVHARCVGARLLHRLSQRAAALRDSSVLSNIVNWDFVAQNLDGQGFERANQEGASAQHARAYCLSR